MVTDLGLITFLFGCVILKMAFEMCKDPDTHEYERHKRDRLKASKYTERVPPLDPCTENMSQVCRLCAGELPELHC